MGRIAVVLLSTFLLVSLARAQTDKDILQATGEVAGELQTCSVYFLVGSACIAPQRPDLGQTYREAADKLGNLAVATGRAVGISDTAYTAQASLYVKAMMNAMGGNCTNIAVLLQKYSEFCQRLSQDADPRLRAWIACIRERKQTCGGPGLP